MRILYLEKTILICFLYNYILLAFVSYINHRKDYLKMILVSFVLAVIDIICLYISSSIIMYIVCIALILSPVLILKGKRIRQCLIIASVVLLMTGASAMFPVGNFIVNIVIMSFVVFIIIGFVPLILKNNYINITKATIRIPDGKEITALIDTGLLTVDAPLVIVDLTSISKLLDISEISMENVVVNTVSSKGNLPCYRIAVLEVSIRGKRRVFNNVCVALSREKLPYDALISAQGL